MDVCAARGVGNTLANLLKALTTCGSFLPATRAINRALRNSVAASSSDNFSGGRKSPCVHSQRPPIFRYGDAKLILNRTNVSIRGADFDVDPPRDLLRGDAVRTMLIEQGPHARQSRRAISLCESLALGISHVHHDHPLVRSRDRVVGRSERNMTV